MRGADKAQLRQQSHQGHGFAMGGAPRRWRSGASSPFKVRVGGGSGSSAWRTVRVDAGMVGGVSATGTATDIVVPASSTGYQIWVDCELANNYYSFGARAGSISTAAIGNGASGWSGFPYMFDGGTNNGLDLYLPVAAVTTSNDTLKTISITQYLNRHFMNFDRTEVWFGQCNTATNVDAGDPGRNFKYEIHMVHMFALADYGNEIFKIKAVRPHVLHDANLLYTAFDTGGTVLPVMFTPEPYIMAEENYKYISVDVALNGGGNQVIYPLK